MKYLVTIITFLLFSAVCFSTRVSSQNPQSQQKDSLWKVLPTLEEKERYPVYIQLANYYIMERFSEGAIDTLLMILDMYQADAHRAGDVTTEGVVRLNRLSTLMDVYRYDDVLSRTPIEMDFLAENGLWRYYYQAARFIPETLWILGDYDSAFIEAEKNYNFAKERDSPEGMAIALSSMANIYKELLRKEKQEETIREAIALMGRNPEYANIVTTFYDDLLNCIISQRRFEDALSVAAEIEEINRWYEEVSKMPRPTAWGNLWLSNVTIYRYLGDFGKAQFYVDKLDSLTNGDMWLYKERGHILYGRGKYEEALEMFDKQLETHMGTFEAKGLKMMVYTEMGEARKALDIYFDVIASKDTLHRHQVNTKLDELRTRHEVEKHIAEKLRNRNYFLFAVAVCGLLFLLLGGSIYYNRIISQKNRNLYRQIKEQDRLQGRLAQIDKNSGGVSPSQSDEGLPGDAQQRKLVERLNEYMVKDRKLTDADINREEFIAALETNKNTLSEAVKAVTGKTLMEYIRSFQLEEARRMLDAHPELTVEAIAFDCGFNATNTFYRQFRKYYGISPTEYRKMAKAANE